jgi:hypothetical protein
MSAVVSRIEMALPGWLSEEIVEATAEDPFAL